MNRKQKRNARKSRNHKQEQHNMVHQAQTAITEQPQTPAATTIAPPAPEPTGTGTDGQSVGTDAPQEDRPRTYVNQNSSNEEILGALLMVGVRVSSNLTRDALIARAEEEKIWEQLKRSVVPDSFKTKYGADQNCGDELAEILRSHDPVEVCLQNGIDPSRWAGKNPGMFRMNLGNVLRGRVRRGDYVVIGDNEWNQDSKPDANENAA